MAIKRKHFVYGPVPSRRLGRSLGVDLVPFKTCTYNCIYCQLGRTQSRTKDRKEWVPFDRIIAEVKEKLHTQPDYITLSGSGEPTLYSRMGELIDEIRSLTEIPVAVITNGSLLSLREVQNDLMNANMVVPSLDAGTDRIFRYVNRPHTSIRFQEMLKGLAEFRQRFQGTYWLEVLLLSGVTTVNDQIERLSKCISTIAPDRVHVNTVVRPPAEDYASPVPPDQLEHLARQLHDHAEVISEFHGGLQQEVSALPGEEIINLLQVRPCSVDDIAAGLRAPANEISKYLGLLQSEGHVRAERQCGKTYYVAVG